MGRLLEKGTIENARYGAPSKNQFRLYPPRCRRRVGGIDGRRRRIEATTCFGWFRSRLSPNLNTLRSGALASQNFHIRRQPSRSTARAGRLPLSVREAGYCSASCGYSGRYRTGAGTLINGDRDRGRDRDRRLGRRRHRVHRRPRIRCWCRRCRHPRWWCHRRRRPRQPAPLVEQRCGCASSRPPPNVSRTIAGSSRSTRWCRRSHRARPAVASR